MKYEIFSPDNESMGFFETNNNHPGNAQRVFNVCINYLFKAYFAERYFHTQFDNETDIKILNILHSLTEQKRSDSLHFYFTPIA